MFTFTLPALVPVLCAVTLMAGGPLTPTGSGCEIRLEIERWVFVAPAEMLSVSGCEWLNATPLTVAEDCRVKVGLATAAPFVVTVSVAVAGLAGTVTGFGENLQLTLANATHVGATWGLKPAIGVRWKVIGYQSGIC